MRLAEESTSADRHQKIVGWKQWKKGPSPLATEHSEASGGVGFECLLQFTRTRDLQPWTALSGPIGPLVKEEIGAFVEVLNWAFNDPGVPGMQTSSKECCKDSDFGPLAALVEVWFSGGYASPANQPDGDVLEPGDLTTLVSVG